jgi:hypothetical protein
MSRNTRIQNKWKGYYLEDIDDCRLCLHYKKCGGYGCGLSLCLYEEERRNAVACGRITRGRKKKWQSEA